MSLKLSKKHKVDPFTQPLYIIFTKETLELERKKKYSDRRSGYYIDERGLYPPFKVDLDCFLLCDYINPETNEECNEFFGYPKSINAHYSRVHNNDQNPNHLRRLEKERKIIEKILDTVPRPYFHIPKTNQSNLSEF